MGSITRSRGPSKLPLAFVSIFLVGIVVLTGCGPSSAPAPAITRDQALTVVFERLTSLAQTPEAKEYVAAFLSLPSTQREYEAESRCWVVQITGVEVELVMKKDWFPVEPNDPDYVDTFRDDHWWQAVWLVYDDGRITPFGKGLIVEADIGRLNSYRTLRSKMTREEAYLAVHMRLTNLAQTSEAKEYVTIFWTDSSGRAEYSDELGAWTIGISPTGYDMIKRAGWFKNDDVGYFFDLHWNEPRPAWIVYDDGKVSPLGKGPMVESDIEQLNTTRKLQ